VTNVTFTQAKQQVIPIIPINLTKGVNNMQEKLPLDSFWRKHQEGVLNKKKLESIIFEYILKNGKRFKLHTWQQDECVDFLCWLYPRISKAIDNYHNEGSSFDAYIITMIRWAAREYCQNQTTHRLIEQTYWDICTRETAVCEEEPDYDNSTAPFKRVSNPRQALLLLLKSYYFISEDFIDRAAPAIGMEKEKLQQLVGQLRELRVHRDEALKELQNHVYSQYYRCITLEKRLNIAPVGSARHEKLQMRLTRARRRLEIMRKRLKRMRKEPTNRQVAKVLGVPKGTIDSNFFAIRTKNNDGDRQKELHNKYYHDDYDDNAATQAVIK
jgi:hypothetical protein